MPGAHLCFLIRFPLLFFPRRESPTYRQVHLLHSHKVNGVIIEWESANLVGTWEISHPDHLGLSHGCYPVHDTENSLTCRRAPLAMGLQTLQTSAVSTPLQSLPCVPQGTRCCYVEQLFPKLLPTLELLKRPNRDLEWYRLLPPWRGAL